MRQIRYGVFETNSSSIHTLTMCSKEEYEDWKNGNLVYDKYEEKFITKDFINEEERIQEGYLSYDEYEEEYVDYEHFEETYVTKNGEKIVAFGYCGYES